MRTVRSDSPDVVPLHRKGHAAAAPAPADELGPLESDHHPLIVARDGRKLSKRDDATYWPDQALRDATASLAPVADALAELLGRSVRLERDWLEAERWPMSSPSK